MRCDVEEIALGLFKVVNSFVQGHPVEAGRDADRVQDQTVELVVNKDRRQASGDDDDRRATNLQVQRNNEHVILAPGLMPLPGHRQEFVSCRNLLCFANFDPFGRKDGSIRIDDETALAADQAQSPTERPVRQRLAARAVEKKVVQGTAELVFLGPAPEPSQPGRLVMFPDSSYRPEDSLNDAIPTTRS